MIIKKVSIQGPCKGVIASINKINKILNDSTIKKPIYMLGKLVHNDNIVKAYQSKGIIILDGDSRINMVKQVTEGTVIITAHGVGDDVYDYLNENHINYVDATCIDVLKTKRIVKEKLINNFIVLYLGTSNHPESEAMNSLSNDIIFVDYKNYESFDFSKINLSNKYFLTCQTTLSYKDVLNVYDYFKNHIPCLEVMPEVCNATLRRQERLLSEAQDYDLCIVVGDKKSNNTKSLQEVCLKYTNTPCIMVQNVEDLNDYDFKNDMKIIITSGASTPSCIVDEIIDNLENKDKPFKCILPLNEYIK